MAMKNDLEPPLVPQLKYEMSSGIKFSPSSTEIIDFVRWSGPDLLASLKIGDYVVAVNGKHTEGQGADITKILSPGVIDILNSWITLTVLRGGIQKDVSMTLTPVLELANRNKLWRLHRNLHASISSRCGSTGLNFILDSENRWRFEGTTTVRTGTKILNIKSDDYFVESIDGVLLSGKSEDDILRLERGQPGVFCTLCLLHIRDGTRLEIPVNRFPLQADQILEEIVALNESIEHDRFNMLTNLILMLQRWKSECLTWRQTQTYDRGNRNIRLIPNRKSTVSEQIRIHCSILKHRKIQNIRTVLLIFQEWQHLRDTNKCLRLVHARVLRVNRFRCIQSLCYHWAEIVLFYKPLRQYKVSITIKQVSCHSTDSRSTALRKQIFATWRHITFHRVASMLSDFLTSRILGMFAMLLRRAKRSSAFHAWRRAAVSDSNLVLVRTERHGAATLPRAFDVWKQDTASHPAFPHSFAHIRRAKRQAFDRWRHRSETRAEVEFNALLIRLMHSRYIKSIHPPFLRWATSISGVRQRRTALNSAVAVAARRRAGADARRLAGACFAAWREASRRRRLLFVTAVRFLTRRHERAIRRCFRRMAAHAEAALADPFAGPSIQALLFRQVSSQRRRSLVRAGFNCWRERWGRRSADGARAARLAARVGRAGSTRAARRCIAVLVGYARGRRRARDGALLFRRRANRRALLASLARWVRLARQRRNVAAFAAARGGLAPTRGCRFAVAGPGWADRLRLAFGFDAWWSRTDAAAAWQRSVVTTFLDVTGRGGGGGGGSNGSWQAVALEASRPSPGAGLFASSLVLRQ